MASMFTRTSEKTILKKIVLVEITNTIFLQRGAENVL